VGVRYDSGRPPRVYGRVCLPPKLAVLVYRVLFGNLIYNDPGATAYHQLNRARELKSLRKRAKLLGFELVESFLLVRYY
jgi:hypothetical protein